MGSLSRCFFVAGSVEDCASSSCEGELCDLPEHITSQVQAFNQL